MPPAVSPICSPAPLLSISDRRWGRGSSSRTSRERAGHVAAHAVVKAPHDGYTLVLTTIAHNAASSMYADLAYNPAKDLKPVVLIAESAGVLVVNATLPPKTVQETRRWSEVIRSAWIKAQ
jgi:hypothetical protein